MKAATPINVFGLTERDLSTIKGILQKYPEIDHVVIFGSRAKGTYKPGSDIDLAVMNTGGLPQTIARISSDLEESNLPYSVDLVYFPFLENQDFISHIKRIGAPFYTRETP